MYINIKSLMRINKGVKGFLYKNFSNLDDPNKPLLKLNNSNHIINNCFLEELMLLFDKYNIKEIKGEIGYNTGQELSKAGFYQDLSSYDDLFFGIKNSKIYKKKKLIKVGDKIDS